MMSSSAAAASSSSRSLGRSSENLPPRTLARVGREVKALISSPPEGVQLVLCPETGMPTSLDNLVAEIEGPTGTPFEGKYFQLKLVLSADFPASPPRGYFVTKIYHPNVEASTGAICVNTLKKDWSPQTTFSHVLSVIRCLLIVPFPESSLNDEAGKLFMESYDEYHRRARLMADVHGRPDPFNYESAGDEEAEAALVGNMNVKLSASGGVGDNNAKVDGALDGADSPVKRSLKRGVSTGANNSSSSSSGGGGGGGGGGSQEATGSIRSLTSTSGVNVLSRSNNGGLSSSGNSMKKTGTDGKKKAVKKKKNNGLGRL